MTLHGRRWRRQLAMAVSTGALVVVASTGSSLLSQEKALASSTPGSWSIVSSPDPSTSVYATLSAVTCTSPTNCWAVGTYTTGSNAHGAYPYYTLAEQYNGTAWSVGTIPTPSGAVPSITASLILNAVTCVDAGDCWAVGAYKDSSLVWHMLTEHYSYGVWSIVPSPNPSGVDYAILDAVTCVDADDCWAVGSTEDDSGKQYTLTEHYDGSAWSDFPSSNPSSTGGALLSAVTCISASNCWAVGSYNDVPVGLSLPQAYTLAEQYSGGTDWTIVPSGTRGGSLTVALPSVTCTSDGTCWAVGTYMDSSLNEGTLAEQYVSAPGATWEIVPSPNPPGATAVDLSGVACTSDSNCWAIGGYDDSIPTEHTLAEQYGGSAWNIVSSPTPSGASSVLLSGVDCTSNSNCWAVGFHSDHNGVDGHTLTEQYEALAITSASATTFTVGTAGTFTVTATGSPPPALSDGGATLPSGVTFTDNGDGTATLAGTPDAGSSGTYPFTITASTPGAPVATQAFTLSVVLSPTSLTASATPGAVSYGTPVSLSATGLPAGATGTITFTDQSASTLCSASVSGGAASCQPSATLAPGTYTVTASYTGDTIYASSVATTSYSVTPDPVLQVSTSGTPSSIQAGDGYTLTVGASLGASGGPAYHGPTLTASLPQGETFAGDLPSGWTCSVSSASTVLTCVSTAVTPIGAGTSLGSVSWVVNVSATAAGPLQTTIVLTDAGDLAAAQGVTATLSSVPPSSPPTPATGSGAGGALPWAPALALTAAGLATLVWRRRILMALRRSR